MNLQWFKKMHASVQIRSDHCEQMYIHVWWTPKEPGHFKMNANYTKHSGVDTTIMDTLWNKMHYMRINRIPNHPDATSINRCPRPQSITQSINHFKLNEYPILFIKWQNEKLLVWQLPQSSLFKTSGPGRSRPTLTICLSLNRLAKWMGGWAWSLNYITKPSVS